jgi:hypothetical protein
VKPWIAPLATTHIIAFAAAAGAPSAFAAPATSEIAPGTPVYQVVEGLARDGLVLGYKDASFLGGRTLTRYEVATLVKRVVDNLTVQQRAQAVKKRAAAAGVNRASPQDASRTTSGAPTVKRFFFAQ